MNGLRKLEWWKNKICKQEIGIAEKSQETRKDCWGGNVNHKFLIWLHKNVYRSLSQNRHLWFTLPPQRSLLISWLFSAIPIPCLKILFFCWSYHLLNNECERVSQCDSVLMKPQDHVSHYTDHVIGKHPTQLAALKVQVQKLHLKHIY